MEGRVGAPLDVAIDTLGASGGVLVWTVSRTPSGPPRSLESDRMERLDLPDRQLDALLERLDRIAAQLEQIDQRLEASEGLLQVTPRAARAQRLAERGRLRGARAVAAGAATSGVAGRLRRVSD